MHYNNMGVLFLQADDPETALLWFEAAVELNPDNPMHHNNMGMAYQELGDRDQANRAFDMATELADREFEAGMAESRR